MGFFDNLGGEDLLKFMMMPFFGAPGFGFLNETTDALTKPVLEGELPSGDQVEAATKEVATGALTALPAVIPGLGTVASTAAGAATGGLAAEAQGGDFFEGAALGAAGPHLDAAGGVIADKAGDAVSAIASSPIGEFFGAGFSPPGFTIHSGGGNPNAAPGAPTPSPETPPAQPDVASAPAAAPTGTVPQQTPTAGFTDSVLAQQPAPGPSPTPTPAAAPAPPPAELAGASPPTSPAAANNYPGFLDADPSPEAAAALAEVPPSQPPSGFMQDGQMMVRDSQGRLQSADDLRREFDAANNNTPGLGTTLKFQGRQLLGDILEGTAGLAVGEIARQGVEALTGSRVAGVGAGRMLGGAAGDLAHNARLSSDFLSPSLTNPSKTSGLDQFAVQNKEVAEGMAGGTSTGVDAISDITRSEQPTSDATGYFTNLQAAGLQAGVDQARIEEAASQTAETASEAARIRRRVEKLQDLKQRRNEGIAKIAENRKLSKNDQERSGFVDLIGLPQQRPRSLGPLTPHQLLSGRS